MPDEVDEIAVATLKLITLATLLNWHEQRLANAGDAAKEAQDAGPPG